MRIFYFCLRYVFISAVQTLLNNLLSTYGDEVSPPFMHNHTLTDKQPLWHRIAADRSIFTTSYCQTKVVLEHVATA